MITCNWPDFTKRTAGTENSSLLSGPHGEIQFNCLGCTPVGALPRAKRREKPIGRGTPCGLPFHGTPREDNPVGALLVGSLTPGPNAERSSIGRGSSLLGALPRAKLREKPIGRGTPACPSPGLTPAKPIGRGTPVVPWQTHAERRQSPGAVAHVGALPGQNAERRQSVAALPCAVGFPGPNVENCPPHNPTIANSLRLWRLPHWFLVRPPLTIPRPAHKGLPSVGNVTSN